jgi:hypothetical protein
MNSGNSNNLSGGGANNNNGQQTFSNHTSRMGLQLTHSPQIGSTSQLELRTTYEMSVASSTGGGPPHHHNGSNNGNQKNNSQQFLEFQGVKDTSNLIVQMDEDQSFFSPKH